MNDFSRTPIPPRPARPDLPAPARSRWQPLRMGLVELFHYDSEEFWFRDGHLLLRGANGAGKSKVLSLTMPFLFDAQLKASRIEPDGDGAKKMAWNLLMNGYDRRVGYAWIEFGRLAEDGTPRYLALGAGLSAAAGRPAVDSWFFILDDAADAPRINQDIWLTSEQRVILSKDRLREAIDGRGQVFDTAHAYRRAVDERLFHLGTRRYEALMDTLIQLRQPQLSRKPDESSLSNALTEALPPLAPQLLGDVAEALGRLEEDRRQLEEYQALARAIDRFELRYRAYAGVQTRRQARALRQSQTEFDSASRARSEAQLHLATAQAAEAQAKAEFEAAELALAGRRTILDTLLADPAMQDANRLDEADKDAADRRRAVRHAERALADAELRLQRAVDETGQWAAKAAVAAQRLAELRRAGAACAQAARLDGAWGQSPLAALDPVGLLDLTQEALDAAVSRSRKLAEDRREQIALLRRRHTEAARLENLHAQRLRERDDRREDAAAAAARRDACDAQVETEGHALVGAWSDHFAGLRQLQLSSLEPLAALTDWVVAPDGDNPAREALEAAHQESGHRLASEAAELEARREILETEQGILVAERAQIEAGADAAPPAPLTRAPDARDGCAGAPLWRLVEFRDDLGAAPRAGLEAALEASGLLDAWVSPDGRLRTADGTAPLDTQLVPRAPRPSSLVDWLRPDVAADGPVPAAVVERILAGVVCGDDEPSQAEEAWISPRGRYRLGPLAGAWTKPAAAYIGFPARATARARRLAQISLRLGKLDHDLGEVRALVERCALARKQAGQERRSAPGEQGLRQAHIEASGAAREERTARERAGQADAREREALQALLDARQGLARDAADLRLPPAADALPAAEAAVSWFAEAISWLAQAVRELRLIQPELDRQRHREDEARQDLAARQEQLAAGRSLAERADARLRALSGAVGRKVEELKAQLAQARAAVDAGDQARAAANDAFRESAVARAAAGERAQSAGDILLRQTQVRTQAVARLQQFVATGLMEAAWPQAEPPGRDEAWTIDPALTLARRAEQALAGVQDDDDAWSRVQRQVNGELEELRRALSALGHHAVADASEWGLAVNVVYQNRPERPDRLAARLAREIAERDELLTANERAVLENHLQAEIAAEIQRLLQLAESQVDAINKELHKRPTSTGVRFRLLWQPLPEEEGAPVGLEAARRRLLNIGADLWSAEDRRVVGAMLQQRIAAERERADAGTGADGGGSLFDQLARALDYRHWHRFRVERWQDGIWRKLSGPASSGERALGLTVPLFAAVASFYSHGGSALAPRLMLLDEAFAGIDDAARAHCMGLIREFDLDFVITSEREWGCYAELLGVAICQLQRREGVDAVFVSRWTWDGRSKTPQADPDRRFAAA
jgi:uncharacterized protein (TIGR02680 family)